MGYSKAEDAGGLTPAKDGSADVFHVIRRTLPLFGCAVIKAISDTNFK